VNLGAIPRDLAAAELFGAQKGAYTGATHEREGYFRAANGGTLFLDEVGEASAEVQVMLLRVLETGKLYPVGSSSPVAVDVRLIAATDANLEERIRQGAFKAPLLHRLAGYEIKIPPLRERREDIGALFYSFAKQELESIGEAARLSPTDPYVEPWLPPVLAARLIQHAWPGNVRQLRNVTRQLVIGSRGRPCLQIDLPILGDVDAASMSPDEDEPAMPAGQEPARRRKSTEVTEQELIAALRESAWDVKAAADRLGVPRSSIYDLMERSPNIRTARDLSADEITRCFRDCGGDLDEMARRLEVSKRALGRRVKELALI
jgi:two-component system nitrogen regulation response regulator GlnG